MLARLAREALANALKHGAGGRATLRVAREEGALVLTVENPAREPAARGSGLGLVSAAARAREAGGSVQAGFASGGRTWRFAARLPAGEGAAVDGSPPEGRDYVAGADAP